MKMRYSDSMQYKMLARLEALPSNAVLRSDFADLGSYRQVSRGLKALIAGKKLVRIGFGVYAKAYESQYINVPVIHGGFDGACKEALNRLGVSWERSQAEKAYNAGLSTQVPVRTVVRLKERFRRTFTYRNNKMLIEGGVNAR